MTTEAFRLATLHRLGVLDTATELELDELVELAARIFDAPSALISLIDQDRQWFKATVGFAAKETARDIAFCDHTIRQIGVLVVEDATKDARFAANPLVTQDPAIRFYAGAPLLTSDGAAIGSLCVFDSRVRTASPYQQAMLATLAVQVTAHLELRSGSGFVTDRLSGASLNGSVERPEHLVRLVEQGSIGYVETTADGVIRGVNPAASRMLGYSCSELVGRSARMLAHPDHEQDIETAVRALLAGERTFYEATRVYRHRTGRPVQLRCTVSYLPATSTAEAGVAALLVDLSGQVSADVHRLVAERDRQQVLDTATDAYISIDGQGSVLEWNAAAQDLFGYTAGAAVGHDLTALIVPADLADGHSDGVRRMAASGQPTLIGRSVEVRARHRDGHLLQVELTVWSDRTDDERHRFHAFCRDISERVAARESLRRANDLLRQGREQLQAAFAASPTADAVLDSAGTFLDVNPAMCRFLGRPAADLVGSRLGDVVYGPDRTAAESAVAQVISAGLPVSRTEMRFLCTDDAVRWGLASLIAMQGGAPSEQAVLRIEDLQTHKELESALARQASYDEVSGLPNRSLFVERIRQALEAPSQSQPVAVLVLELEGLHAVIDRDGYAGSDRVLALVARRLGNGLPAGVTVAHLQPGQFGTVVPGGPAEASRLAEQFLTATRLPVDLHGDPVLLRASIGISSAAPQGQDTASQIGHLVQDAEIAAKLARAEGGDAAVFAAPEMRMAQQRLRETEQLIRDALANDTVGVAYQPVFDLATGLIVGAEALLRMSDPTGAPIAPLDVVPAAEASGLIVDIGRRVLQLAASQVARWREEHGILLPVAVNVSAVQLGRTSFPDDVLQAVAMAGVPPQALSLELTESVLLKTGSAGMAQLRDLRDAGIQLAIDDFGTGYASLSYLRDLPAATLKVDRSFVEGIPDDRGAMAIVASVIGLAKNFGMTCVAEGIETEAQRAYLAERGVLGQGYLLARPADGYAISRILARSGATQALVQVEALTVPQARDLAGRERDDAGDQRDQAGDQRDLVGDERDHLADRRDQAGDQRDQAADRRDDVADERDREGAHRDHAAEQRDHDAERSEADSPPTTSTATAEVNRSALARREAAADRERALQDRQAGATERAHAGADRDTALTDRGAGATERFSAELDRNIAFADRGFGAGERASAEDDRSTAHADRDASARERERYTTDGVSGTYVRDAGLAELAREVTRACRQQQPLVLAFVEVDQVRTSNGTAGSAAGDQVVPVVAASLRATLRSYDLVLRYGAGQFLCAMSGLGAPGASATFSRVDAALAAQSLSASVTVGLAELRADDTPSTLIARADADCRRGREPRR